MARRHEPPDSLDYFPTPLWATRALCKHVLPGHLKDYSVWEPACGEGHMAAPLAEYFAVVYATDIFEYKSNTGKCPPFWYRDLDFLSDEVDDWRERSGAADWIVTNPPFNAALDFTLLALERARVGVAIFARVQFIESIPRYERLFKKRLPTIFAPFVERVPLLKGRWDHNSKSATNYAWFVWVRGVEGTTLKLIPPGCRKSLTLPGDVERFGALAEAPLFEANG
jgi:predicted RNA methylase